MIVVLSPAKNLDFTPVDGLDTTLPKFKTETNALIKKLRKLSASDISKLMSLSANLSDLNYERYHKFKLSGVHEDAKAAILAFNGEVYNGLNAEQYTVENMRYAQNHLRILSGLYGLLAPLDLIQPYRLEMGTKFPNDDDGKNLYAFWDGKITRELNKQLKTSNSSVLINLASNEYFKAIKKEELNAEIITPTFVDYKNGDYKVVMVYAKNARGSMASYIVRNEISNPEKVKEFDLDGYSYNENLSKGNNWVFSRG